MDSKRIRTFIAFSFFLSKLTSTFANTTNLSFPPYNHQHDHAHYVLSPMDSPYLYAHNHIHEHPHEHVYTTAPVILHPIASAPSSSFVNETTNQTDKAKTSSATPDADPTVPFIICMGLCCALL